MTRRPASRALGLFAGLALSTSALAGCDVPNVPLTDLPDVIGSSGPTIQGNLKDVETTGKVRVGLIGSTGAGKPRMELRSTAVSGSSFSLTLPAVPSNEFMVNDNESILLMLTAYEDANGNGRFDASGDQVLEAAAPAGTFRYFSDAGPSYQKGWNLFENGTYTQNFPTAFVMTGGVSAFRVMPFGS